MLSGAIAPEKIGARLWGVQHVHRHPAVGRRARHQLGVQDDAGRRCDPKTMVLAGISLCVAGTLNLIIRENDMRRGA